MATSQDIVAFVNVQKSYPPGEKLLVEFQLKEELKRSRRDWVGLFKVGWTSSRDYYTFEWVTNPEDTKNVVTFAGRRLPPEDNHFYQFCYVTSDGRVRGASSPFQFLAVSLARIDDLELVEATGDSSLLVVQPKVDHEISTQQEEFVEVPSLNHSLKAEKDTLVKRVENLDKVHLAQLDKKDAIIKEYEECNSQLERQLAAKRDSEQRLIEKLDRERALNHELTSARNNSDDQMIILQKQITQMKDEANSLREALKTEVEDHKAQLQIKNAQIEDLGLLASTRGEEKEQLVKETEQLQGRLLEVQQIRADLIEDNEAKQLQINQLNGIILEKDKMIQTAIEEEDKLKEELMIAQQNVAELVGAGSCPVTVEQPVTNEPPTQPPTQDSIVDKAAYDALRQAYDSLEDDFNDLKKAKNELATKHQIRNEELVTRLNLAQEEYKQLAKENHRLEKQITTAQKESSVGGQVRDLESINKELVSACELATEQLTERKEESKKLQSRNEKLEEELAKIKLELEQFMDKHDKIVHAKTESLDKQQAVLDEKLRELVECQQSLQAAQREKTKLELTVQQLRTRLGGLKDAASKSSDRSCPVCHTKFPQRVSQQDFERHVNGHFS